MRTRAAAAALSIVAVLPVAGCYQGFDQTVNDQGPSGNGTDLQVGPLLVQDTTIVAGDAGLRGALLMTVVNTGEADDALVAVQTDPASVSSLRQPLTLPAGAAVKVGAGSPTTITLTGLRVPAGSYAMLRLSFRDAGSQDVQVAVVPASGYYAGFGPAAAGSASPAAG